MTDEASLLAHLSRTVPVDVSLQLELVFRLFIGLVLGAAIGWERERHNQPAGFRTHSLVALGASMFTLISEFGFGERGGDSGRMAAQIVSGIGFIGAGTVLRHKGKVRGLTTAASLWAVAAVGTAAGTGMYVLAFAGTAMVLAVLSLLDRIESAAHRNARPPDPGADRNQVPPP